MSAQSFMLAHAAEHGDDYIDRHEPSVWLRDRLTELYARLKAKDVTTCGHLTVGMFGVMTLWRPGWATCLDCVYAAFAVYDDEDETCDRCGVVAPVEALMSSPHSRVLLLYRLCTRCYDREVGGGRGD